MKKKILKIIVIFLIVIMAIVTTLFIVTEIFFFQFIVVGSSMEPTLKEGYIGYACKVQYTSISRNDIIIYTRNDEANEYEVIKRVIGLPNEHVVIDKTGQIYINNEKLDESSYLGSPYLYTTYLGSHFDITLGENEYFTLGDNRANSLDGRYYGSIKKDAIKGKLKCVYKYATCGDDKSCDSAKSYSTKYYTFKFF